MDIPLSGLRKHVVNDTWQKGEINSAGCNVSGHQESDSLSPHPTHDFFALRLGKLSVENLSGVSLLFQIIGYLRRAIPRIAEYDGVFGLFELDQTIQVFETADTRDHVVVVVNILSAE